MNWKVVLIGGVAFYVTMFLVSFATGYLIHSPHGVLFDTYRETESFWRPELNANPPDMAALLPSWIATGLVSAFIAAGIYSAIRSSLAGPPWQRGLKFGVIAVLFALVNMLGYRGVLNLPDDIWQWWLVERAALYLAGGLVLGIVADKLSPVRA